MWKPRKAVSLPSDSDPLLVIDDDLRLFSPFPEVIVKLWLPAPLCVSIQGFRSILAATVSLLFFTVKASGAQVKSWTAQRDWSLSNDTLRLDAVISGAQDRNGNLCVALLLDRRVVCIDGSGKIVRLIGRSGAGPGEFQRPVALGWAADTLWVSDNALRRFNKFEPNGGFRSLSYLDALATSNPRGENLLARPIALLNQGKVLLEAAISGNDSSRNVSQEQLNVLVGDLASHVVDSLAKLKRRKPILVISLPNGSTYRSPNPFALNDLVSVDPYGRIIVTAGLPDEYRSNDTTVSIALTAFAIDGTKIYSNQIPIRSSFLNQAELDDLLRRREAMIGQGGRGSSRASIIDGPKPGDPAPPVSRMLVASDLAVWLSLSPTEWLIVDARGKFVGTLSLPSTTRHLVAASAEHVWTLNEHATGDWSLTRYRLSK